MNKEQIKAKKMLITILTLVVVILGIFASSKAYADLAQQTKFESVNVMADLKSADAFDIRKYPFDSTGAHSAGIINFIEYCYSPFSNMQSNYGLYIYFYNPKNISIVEKAGQNKVEIATEFNDKNIPINYQKFDLEFCNKSEGDQFNKFFKFKIVNSRHFLDVQNSEERKYAVSGVELLEKSKQTADEYRVGGIYTYSGYAKGYGADPNTDTTLKCNVSDLTTIKLDNVGKTSYTFEGTIYDGGDYHDQIASTYFSIPKGILNEYGGLQRIKFEYYEFTTSPIIVTDNRAVYNKILSNRNKNSNTDFALIAGGPMYDNMLNPNTSKVYLGWMYNQGLGSINDTIDEMYKFSTQLPIVFFRENIGNNDIKVTSQDLLDYIYDYKESNFNGYLSHRNLTKDLFMNTSADGFEKAKQVKEIDADELTNLKEITLESGWDRFWRKLFGKKPPSTMHTIKPIQEIKKLSDIDTLYIDSNDRNAVKSAYNNAVANDEVLHLFNFAINPYLSVPISSYDGFGDVDNATSFMAETVAYLDLDFIEFTFLKEGKYTTIPVVMSPIDHIGNIHSPTFKKNQLFFTLGIILVVIIVAILTYFLIKILRPLFSTKKNKPKKSKKGKNGNDNKEFKGEYTFHLFEDSKEE